MRFALNEIGERIVSEGLLRQKRHQGLPVWREIVQNPNGLRRKNRNFALQMQRSKTARSLQRDPMR